MAPMIVNISFPIGVLSNFSMRCVSYPPSSALLAVWANDKVDEMVMALLYLTRWEEAAWGARAWKSHDWDALDRLHAKGYISDPKGKAKSVVLSPEGLRRARELFEQHFARKSPPTEDS